MRRFKGSAKLDAELEERDFTDVGLSNPLSAEALATLRERARHRRDDVPVGPPALPEQRSRAMDWVARELGWTRPSQSEVLCQPCVSCGVELGWCRVGLRVVTGRLCNDRGTG